jgi:hypothetical protein
MQNPPVLGGFCCILAAKLLLRGRLFAKQIVALGVRKPTKINAQPQILSNYYSLYFLLDEKVTKNQGETDASRPLCQIISPKAR